MGGDGLVFPVVVGVQRAVPGCSLALGWGQGVQTVQTLPGAVLVGTPPQVAEPRVPPSRQVCGGHTEGHTGRETGRQTDRQTDR